jgi:hypothetical protein
MEGRVVRSDLITRHYALINLSHGTVLETLLGLELEGAVSWDVSPYMEIVFATAADQVAFRMACNDAYREAPGALPPSGEFSMVAAYGTGYVDPILDQLSMRDRVAVIGYLRLEMSNSRESDRFEVALGHLAASKPFASFDVFC